jgi:hypothetical protein
VRVTRQIHRREVWYVLADPVSGRFHRMNAAAYAFVGAATAPHVEALSEACSPRPRAGPDPGRDRAPPGAAQPARLIQCELTPDVAAIFHREQQDSRQAAPAGRESAGFPAAARRPERAAGALRSWPDLRGWMLLVWRC